MEALNGLGLEDGEYFIPNVPPDQVEKRQEIMTEAEGKPWAKVTYNNKMENKVSAAQSASKASAPLGSITQAGIKAYKAKQQENSSAALKLKKEKKPTPEPGLYAYKVRSANFEHGFTRFGVKNIKNNNKNNKVKPGTKTNSTNHKSTRRNAAGSNCTFGIWQATRNPNSEPSRLPSFLACRN